MNTHEVENLFYSKFEELNRLYSKVKKKILLAEGYSNRYILAPVNELRSSFDHIFRCVGEDKEKTEAEFDSAFRHLKRSGYDACEIIVTTIIDKIVSLLEGYSSQVLSGAFRYYYDEIKPYLIDCENKYIISARNNKKYEVIVTAENREEFFVEFEEITNKAIEYLKLVNKQIPVLEAYKSKVRNEYYKKVIRTIIILVIGGILGFFGSLLANRLTNTTSKHSLPTNTEQINDSLDSN